MEVKRVLIKLFKIIIVALLIYTVHNYMNSLDLNSLEYDPLMLQIVALMARFIYGFVIVLLIFDNAALRDRNWHSNIPGLILIFALSCVDVLHSAFLYLPDFIVGSSMYFQLIFGGWCGLILRLKLDKSKGKE